MTLYRAKKMTSPTQRSLKHLRDNGWHAEVVEYWHSFTKRRRDLLGFADILAMKEGETPLLLQTTTDTHLSERRTKIHESQRASLALKSGFRIIIHGWKKRPVKRGGKAMTWQVREEEVFANGRDC